MTTFKAEFANKIRHMHMAKDHILATGECPVALVANSELAQGSDLPPEEFAKRFVGLLQAFQRKQDEIDERRKENGR